jgi:RNA polymerase sigma-70 factor (ECF subfamily)
MRELYRRHSPTIVSRLARATGCRDSARDLAHETFLRLMQMPPAALARIERPDAYLRKIATNLLRDWGRARAVAARAHGTLEVLGDPIVDQIAVLESRETLRRLELAMTKLKPKTREIFLAHRIEGLSYAEISVRTGLSVKGVEKQMSKAIAMIDRMLDRT